MKVLGSPFLYSTCLHPNSPISSGYYCLYLTQTTAVVANIRAFLGRSWTLAPPPLPHSSTTPLFCGPIDNNIITTLYDIRYGRSNIPMEIVPIDPLFHVNDHFCGAPGSTAPFGGKAYDIDGYILYNSYDTIKLRYASYFGFCVYQCCLLYVALSHTCTHSRSGHAYFECKMGRRLVSIIIVSRAHVLKQTQQQQVA